MKLPNKNDFITVTTQEYIQEGTELNFLPGKIVVKEKTDEYIVLESSYELTEVNQFGMINLSNGFKEIKINKGESKVLTLAMTDFPFSATIKY